MKKPTPVKGWAFFSFRMWLKKLLFLLFQRFAKNVAEARTGIG